VASGLYLSEKTFHRIPGATIWINSKLPWRRIDIALNPQ
jgi:hypothetical protein